MSRRPTPSAIPAAAREEPTRPAAQREGSAYALDPAAARATADAIEAAGFPIPPHVAAALAAAEAGDPDPAPAETAPAEPKE